MLVNVKTFGAASILKPSAKRYPRERLFIALAILLWSDWSQPENTALLQKTLITTATDFSGFVHAYEQLWHRFN